MGVIINSLNNTLENLLARPTSFIKEEIFTKSKIKLKYLHSHD